MKKNLLFGLVVLAFIATAGCASRDVSPEASRDYYDGAAFADVVAKKDAMDFQCWSVNGPVDWYDQARPHLEELKVSDRSREYIRGFRDSYKQVFMDYLQAYCDKVDFVGKLEK